MGGLKRQRSEVSAWISVYLPPPGEWRGRAVGLEGGLQAFLSGTMQEMALHIKDPAGPAATAGRFARFRSNLRTKRILIIRGSNCIGKFF